INVTRNARKRRRNLPQARLNRRCKVITAGRGLKIGLEIEQKLVIKAKNSAGIKSGLERLRIALAGDVFEYFVDVIPPLQHRIVVALGADEMGQWKLLAGEIKLQCVGEGDLKWIILSPRPPFQQKLPLFAMDHQFWRFSRAARVFGDGIDN